MINKGKIYPYILVAPALIALGVILLYPMLTGLFLSFQNRVLTRPLENGWIGLQNYINMFQDDVFWISIVKTFWWVVASVGFQIILGMAASCADHFIKRQGLMGIVILLDRNPDLETTATCCRVVSSICSVTNASYSILATGIISRICQAIQTSVQPLVDFFCAIRLISMQSLDCLQEVVNSHIAQTFIRYAQKSQDAQSVLEIMWTLSLFSTSCTGSLQD